MGRLRYILYLSIASVPAMPISLRLPIDIETKIAVYGARQGLSKSAVIVRSIQEFLAKNAQPSSLQIYEDVMRDDAKKAAKNQRSDDRREAAEQRPLKQQVREVIRSKHAARSERARQALSASGAKSGATVRRGTRKSA